MTSLHPKISAVVALLIAIGQAVQTLIDNDPTTNPNYAMLASLAVVCYGLFSARQNNVTSEQAGAKPGV